MSWINIVLSDTISEMMKKQEEQKERTAVSPESKINKDQQSDNTPISAKSVKIENLPFSSCGMLDRTRIALCTFLFAFLLVSPLNYMIPNIGAGKNCHPTTPATK